MGRPRSSKSRSAGSAAPANAMKIEGEVESLLTSVKESYVPSYAALARAHIRSLEQSAYLRRLAIASFKSPVDGAEVARLRALVEQKAKEAGATAYLAKPLDVAELLAVVDDAVGAAQRS